MTEASRVQKLLIAQETEIVSLKQRIKELETIMQKLVEPFKKSAPLFGAQNLRSVRVGDQVVEEVLAALGGKKDG